jgi:hypothetical protein
MKDEIKLRKLWPLKVEEVNNSKKNHQMLQKLVTKDQKSSLYVVIIVKK